MEEPQEERSGLVLQSTTLLSFTPHPPSSFSNPGCREGEAEEVRGWKEVGGLCHLLPDATASIRTMMDWPCAHQEPTCCMHKCLGSD